MWETRQRFPPPPRPQLRGISRVQLPPIASPAKPLVPWRGENPAGTPHPARSCRTAGQRRFVRGDSGCQRSERPFESSRARDGHSHWD